MKEKDKKPVEQKHHVKKDNGIKRRVQRKALSTWRVWRYGMESFFRNSWLSVAATAVMVITLMIIFSAFAIQNISTSTIDQLRQKVDMSIYLDGSTPDKELNMIISDLRELKSVKSTKFVTSAMAREEIAKENSGDSAVLEAIKEATNKLPTTIKVVIEDINDTSELQKFVSTNELVKKYLNKDHAPSFAGDRKQSIETIGRAVGFAQKAAIAAGLLFIVISSLIIFNTIQMAIFNRKEEIQMMKLIGADKSFIRGPFLVESVFYGVIAAIIATGLGIFTIFQTQATLEKYFYIEPTIVFVTTYALPITLCMVVAGAIIGVCSSLLATRRYLKI